MIRKTSVPLPFICTGFWALMTRSGFPKKEMFFNDFFEKLVGNSDLRAQIKAGKTEAEIRKTWEKDLRSYKAIRKNYLLYTDF